MFESLQFKNFSMTNQLDDIELNNTLIQIETNTSKGSKKSLVVKTVN